MGKDKPARGPGRPTRGKPAKMIGVSVTVEEREQYEAAAASKSMSLAEWIRAACAAFLKRAKR